MSGNDHNPNRCDWCGRYMTTGAPSLTFTTLRGVELTQRFCPVCYPNAQAMAEHNRQVRETQASDAQAV